MANDLVTIGPLHAHEFVHADLSNTQITLTGVTKVYAVTVDNTQNSAVGYLKIWDGSNTAGAHAVGTDQAHEVRRVAAGAKRTFLFEAGGHVGVTILYAAFLTTAAKTATTGPTENVEVRLWTN